MHIWYQGHKRKVRFTKTTLAPYVIFGNKKCYIRRYLNNNKCKARIQVGGVNAHMCGSSGCAFLDEGNNRVYKYFFDSDDLHDDGLAEISFNKEQEGISYIINAFKECPQLLERYTVILPESNKNSFTIVPKNIQCSKFILGRNRQNDI